MDEVEAGLLKIYQDSRDSSNKQEHLFLSVLSLRFKLELNFAINLRVGREISPHTTTGAEP